MTKGRRIIVMMGLLCIPGMSFADLLINNGVDAGAKMVPREEIQKCEKTVRSWFIGCYAPDSGR